jgi:hypothetical protein
MTKISNSRKILFEIWDLEFGICYFFAAVSRPWSAVQGFIKCMLFGLIEVR